MIFKNIEINYHNQMLKHLDRKQEWSFIKNLMPIFKISHIKNSKNMFLK